MILNIIPLAEVQLIKQKKIIIDFIAKSQKLKFRDYRDF